MNLFKLVLGMSLLLSIHSARGSDLDPTYKDDAVQRLHRTLGLNGALQVDKIAIENHANEWQIKVEFIELKGSTKQAIDTQYANLLKRENMRFLRTSVGAGAFDAVRESYPEVIPKEAKILTPELAQKISSETDATAFVEQDSEVIRQWLLNELLTNAGRLNAEYYLKDGRLNLEFLRLHADDQGSGVIGDDLLFIRGVKRVIIVRLSYVHS